MPTKIQLRRGTAAEWSAANPVLSAGEVGVERETGVSPKLKVGDGTTAWNSLPYVATDISTLATDAELAAALTAAVDAHAADTTAVHGIPDGALLATDAEVAAAIAAEVARANGAYASLVTRRAAHSLSMGGTNTSNSQSSVNQRYFVRLPVTTTRWRLRLANYDCKNSVAGTALTGSGAYLGEHARGALGVATGNFTAAPTEVIASGFTIPGDGTQYVSGWITDAAKQFTAGRDYVLSVGMSSGGAVAIFRGYGQSALGFGGAQGATHVADQTPNLTLFGFAFLDAVIEYEVVGSDRPVGLFIGDSLTEGYMNPATAAAAGSPHQTWAQIAALRNAAPAVVNGIAGAVVSTWSPGTGLRWTRVPLADIAPDYAVIALGSNDAAAGTPLATFQTNMETLVNLLRNTYGIRRISLGTIMPRGLTTNEAIRTSYNAWIRSLPLNATDVFDFDRHVRDGVAPSTLDAAFNSGDGIHVNIAGHARMSDDVLLPTRAPVAA